MESSSGFKNLMQVYEHLAGAYRVGKSTVYNHAREGKLLPNKNGVYPIEKVEAYAEHYLKNKSGQKVDDIQKAKAKADLKLRQLQTERVEFKLEVERGLYIPREEFESALANRAVLFKSGLHRLAFEVAEPLIDLVEGDRGKAPELVRLLRSRFNEHLDRCYAKADPEGESQA